MGATAADRLALESNCYLPAAATLVDAGQALLDADAMLNNGAHSDTIRHALMRRGLLSLPGPGRTGRQRRHGGHTASTVGVAWPAIDDLPVAYEVQVSLDRVWPARWRMISTVAACLPALCHTAICPGRWRTTRCAGPISHNQSSVLQLDVDLVAPGQVVFDWHVDSEAGADLFTFAVDGQTVLAVGQAQPVAVFAGFTGRPASTSGATAKIRRSRRAMTRF